MSKRRPRARPTVHQSKVEGVPPVWAFCLITLIAATAMRLCLPIAWGERHSLASAFFVGDARPYHDYAAHLVAARTFDNGVPFHPPGWAIVLSGFFRLAGFDPLNGRPAEPALLKSFVAFLSGLTVSLAALVAYRVAGRGAMYATGAWGSIHFGHMVLGTVPSNETLYGLLVVVVVLIALRLIHLPAAEAGLSRHVAAGLLGLAAGAAALVRAEFLSACILLVAGIWWAGKGGTRLGVMAAYALGALVVLVPATVSNWRSISAFNGRNAMKLPGPLPRFAPVTSYGAFNFAIANHQHSDGGPNNDHPVLETAVRKEQDLLAEGGLNLASPAVHLLYVDGYRIGFSWIVRNPADAAELMIEKGRRAAGSLAHGVLFDNVPAGVDGTRRRVDLLDPASRVLWPFSIALAAAGIWMLRGRPDAWLLCVPLAALALSTLGFFGYVRLGVAYLPVIWVFQSVAVAAVAAKLPWPRSIRRRPGVTVTILMLILVSASIFSLGLPRGVDFDGPRDADGQVIADETVRVMRQ